MVVGKTPVPQKEDAVNLDFDPSAGREQAGRRPALVLSPSAYNDKVGLAIVCPITRQVKGYPFEVEIPRGLGVDGVILADHVKSLDWRKRNGEVICQLPIEVIENVLRMLNTLTGPVANP